MHIALYASAHGLGHGVRLAEVGRAILAREPGCRLTFRGRVRESLLRARVDGAFEVDPREVDVGLVETDQSTQDLAETARRGQALLEEWEDLCSEEARILRESRTSAVVSDLPGIPLEAAADAGIPGIAVGNFSWDWVYEAYEERLGQTVFGRMARRFRRAYRSASCLARLPVGPPMTAFRQVVDVGLAGRRGDELRAAEIRRKYKLPAPSVFLAIGKLTSREELRRAIRQCPGYHFFGFLDLGGGVSYRRLPDSEQRFFPELLRVAEVVVTTLGHSILSECAANGAPIVTPPRLDYPEYDILLAQGGRCHPIVEIGLEAFRAGKWSEALERARSLSPPESRPSTDGAGEIADLVLRTAREATRT